MTKSTFQLHYDTETGISYVKKVIDEVQKNHQECDNEIITGFMPQMLDDNGKSHKLCPVRCFENYITNLHPENESLWQKAAKKFSDTPGKPWYCNRTVRHNIHDNFMSLLSEDCKLSKRYTNHCIHVTGITSLKRSNFTDKQVMSITGHKSVDSLAIYQRIKSDEKLMMGMCLTLSLLRPEDASMIQNRTDSPQVSKIALPAPAAPTSTNVLPSCHQNSKDLIPLENAITPYQPPVSADTTNLDLMALIADVQSEEIPDEELVLAATQCESEMLPTSQMLLPVTTTSTSATTVMRKITNPTPTFTNCTFGTIGTLNIHIHKH